MKSSTKRLAVAAVIAISSALTVGAAPGQTATQQSPAPTKEFGKLHGGLAEAAAQQEAPPSAGRFAAPAQVQVEPVPVTDGKVVIDAIASGSATALRADLTALGLEEAAVAGRIVSGLLPVDALTDAGKLSSLKFMQPALATTQAGSVQSQGDVAQQTNVARTALGVDGTGVAVGAISDSYNCLGGAAAGVTSGDLPAGVNVVEEAATCTTTDEGRGMLEIVHDVAPGSPLLFHTGNGGQATFAQGITDLRNAGADVVVDDLVYAAEPMFQDGVIAQSVDASVAAGVPYFSSAANYAANSYEHSDNPSGNLECTESFDGTGHDFDPGAGVDTRQQITIPTGRTVFSLQWNQPFFSVSGAPGATTDMDMCFYTSGGGFIGGVFNNNVGGDAVETIAINNPGAAAAINIVISRFSGPSPTLLKYVILRSTASIDQFATNSSTSFGHNNAAGAHAIGAAEFTKTPPFGQTPPLQEPFSSRGGTPILFTTTGTPTNVVRQTPDVVGPDGANTSFFGSDSTNDVDAFPNFFGTSAAAPHVAAYAALLKQEYPAETPAQIYSRFETTAIDMGTAGYDRDTGWGLVTFLPPVNTKIVKSCPAIGVPGGTVTCTLTVSNEGTVAATNVVVSDDLPAGETLVGTPSGTGFTCGIGDPFQCTRPSLAASASVVITYTVLIAESVAPGTALNNTATVAQAEVDGTPLDNTAMATTTVPACSIDRRTSTSGQRINGTAGPDVICGSPFGDQILGLGGDDIILGFGGGGILDGGEGNDTIVGGSGADQIIGGNGNDTMYGLNGNDGLTGNAGTDAAHGGNGVDRCSSSETNTGCEQIAPF